jgi:hypothetical protein
MTQEEIEACRKAMMEAETGDILHAVFRAGKEFGRRPQTKEVGAASAQTENMPQRRGAIDDREVWKASDLAAVLNVHVATLRRWRKLGMLTVSYLSTGQRTARYTGESVRRLIKGGIHGA